MQHIVGNVVHRDFRRVQIGRLDQAVHQSPVDQLERAGLGLKAQKSVARLVVAIGSERRWRLDLQAFMDQCLANVGCRMNQKYEFGKTVHRILQR